MGQRRTGVGVGTASLIMIFLVLCLTTFSILSFLSARLSLKYANKGQEYQEKYYTAKTVAYEFIAEIDNAIIAGDKTLEDKDAIIKQLELIDCLDTEKTKDGIVAKMLIKINTNNNLDLEILIPKKLENKRYIIRKMQTVVNQQNYENGQNVWQG